MTGDKPFVFVHVLREGDALVMADEMETEVLWEMETDFMPTEGIICSPRARLPNF